MLVYYVLSGGRHPFVDSPYSCKRNIVNGRYDLSAIEDRAARDLVASMLCSVPDCRPTVVECLNHVYFTNRLSQSPAVGIEPYSS